MKTKTLELMMMGLMLSIGASSQAQDFGGKNGGDVQEKRFNQIADDIREWIKKGGAKALTLPDGITQAGYESSMLNVLSKYRVSFVARTLKANGVEKDCINLPAKRVIRCNIDRFKNVTQSDQYVITHHEFAGLAGLESNEGQARSNYAISDQITDSLTEVTQLKLAVKDAPIKEDPNLELMDALGWKVTGPYDAEDAKTDNLTKAKNFLKEHPGFAEFLKAPFDQRADFHWKEILVGCIQFKSLDVFYYLYSIHSLDVNAGGEDSIYAYGLKQGDLSLVSFLKEKGGKMMISPAITDLMIAARGNSVEVVKYLISKSTPVNFSLVYVDPDFQTNTGGRTALMEAARTNEGLLVTQELIRSGANVNATTPEGFTPLMIAASNNGNIQILKALIEAGADIHQSAAGYNDVTALELAVIKNENVNFVETVQLLKAAGAKLDPSRVPLLLELATGDTGGFRRSEAQRRINIAL